jgi:reverse gyrase
VEEDPEVPRPEVQDPAAREPQVVVSPEVEVVQEVAQEEQEVVDREQAVQAEVEVGQITAEIQSRRPEPPYLHGELLHYHDRRQEGVHQDSQRF